MSVFFKSDVIEAIHEVLDELCKISKTNSDRVLKLDQAELKLKTPLQACIELRFDDKLRSSIHRLIIEHCFSAESTAPGSFVMTLHKTKKRLEEGFTVKKQSQSVAPTLVDLKNMFYSMSDDHVLNDIIYEAVTLAGFKGNISIEKSLNSTASVELIEGYTFKHNPMTSLKPTKLHRPKIILIDGYIESVSEINLLLQDAAEQRHQLILVSRGMHDDVITTCKVNRDRSTMHVYPIIIDFDLGGINTISDMCIVGGCLPVSCNLGNLISTIRLSDAVLLDECTILRDSIIIKNVRTKSSVISHVRGLIEKLASKNEDVASLLSDRIKTLTNSNVIIRLADDSSFVHKSQMIDYSLRSFKSALSYGMNEDRSLFTTDLASNISSATLTKNLLNIGSYVNSIE